MLLSTLSSSLICWFCLRKLGELAVSSGRVYANNFGRSAIERGKEIATLARAQIMLYWLFTLSGTVAHMMPVYRKCSLLRYKRGCAYTTVKMCIEVGLIQIGSVRI